MRRVTRSGMNPADPDDAAEESLSDVEELRRAERERDGVASLHDSEADSGDEEGVADDFDIDQAEASELGVALDPVDGPEPELD